MTFKKILGLACVTGLVLFLLCACAAENPIDPATDTNAESTDTDPATQESIVENEEETTAENADDPAYSILFIGNSYTYYNDMPTSLFASIAYAAGYDVEVTTITQGSHTLKKFADPFDTFGERVATALWKDHVGDYDYVVLQEQSALPAKDDRSAFYDAVRKLSEKIREIEATPILYATWGREPGNSTLTKYNWTSESMTWRLPIMPSERN